MRPTRTPRSGLRSRTSADPTRGLVSAAVTSTTSSGLPAISRSVSTTNAGAKIGANVPLVSSGDSVFQPTTPIRSPCADARFAQRLLHGRPAAAIDAHQAQRRTEDRRRPRSGRSGRSRCPPCRGAASAGPARARAEPPRSAGRGCRGRRGSPRARGPRRRRPDRRRRRRGAPRSAPRTRRRRRPAASPGRRAGARPRRSAGSVASRRSPSNRGGS